MKLNPKIKHKIIEYLINGITYEEIGKRFNLETEIIINVEKEYLEDIIN